METVDNKMARWNATLQMKKDSRLLFVVDFLDEMNMPRPWPNPDNRIEREKWTLAKYRRQVDRLDWLRDDRIPFIDYYTGTEIFAEAFGCKVHIPSDNIPFALPLVRDAIGASRVRIPRIDSTPLYSLIETVARLQREAGSGALVRIVDMQTPMDIAALIWDKNTFLVAMLEEPEAVRELAEKVLVLVREFMDLWVNTFGTTFVAHCPDYILSSGISLSVDEIGIVGPDAFEEFFLPELSALSNRYNGLGVHCCANARHQWEGLRRLPGLRVLNFVQPEPILDEAVPFFSNTCVQMHAWPMLGMPDMERLQSISAAHAILNPWARDRAEAQAICDRLQAFRSDAAQSRNITSNS